MLDHVSFSVKDFPKSAAFFDATLPLLGYERLHSFEGGNGYGKNGKAAFWIAAADPASTEQIGNAQGFHLAFIAPSAEAVNAWHAKCLELGAKDNGAPGPRKEYHPGYYGAFVVDLNGWRLEAVLHHHKTA